MRNLSRRNLGWRLLSLTSPRLRTPCRNQSSGLLPEEEKLGLILLEITEVSSPQPQGHRAPHRGRTLGCRQPFPPPSFASSSPSAWCQDCLGVFSLHEKWQGSPSAADEGKADEESQQENWAGDTDGNCASFSQTFLLRLAYILSEQVTPMAIVFSSEPFTQV